MNLKYFILLIIGTFGYAQNSAIDSLNNLPYSHKIQNAEHLIPLYLKNAKSANKLHYPIGEASSYSNLALIYYYQGKYSLQVENSLKALRLFETANALDKLALEYAEFGYRVKRRDFNLAMRYMNKGKTLAEKINDTVSLLSIYNNYGVLKEMKNELDSALFFYRKGLSLKKIVKDSVGIPYSLNAIAGVYILQNRFSDAKILYNEALLRRQKINDGVGIAENYDYLGDLYRMQNENRKALESYQNALELALKYNYIDLISGIYKSISETNEKLGNLPEAFTNFKKYEQFKDSLTNKETNSKIAELEVRFDTNNKEKLLIQNKNLLLQKEAEARRKNYIVIMLVVFLIFVALIARLLYRQQVFKNKQQQQEHELKSAITQIETQNKLHEQRLLISRDLHDNIGSQLTFIISSVDNITYAFDLKNSKLDSKLQSISSFARETILELRDTIWVLNTTNMTLEDLRSRILNFIEKAQSAKEHISFVFVIDSNLNAITFSALSGMNVYRIIQESVNNALKYAHAHVIRIEVNDIGNEIEISIHDDGIGFDQQNFEPGNGLQNMSKRIAELNGNIKVISAPNDGTQVIATFPKP